MRPEKVRRHLCSAWAEVPADIRAEAEVPADIRAAAEERELLQLRVQELPQQRELLQQRGLLWQRVRRSALFRTGGRRRRLRED